MLFRLKIASKSGETRNEPRKQCLRQVTLSFEGYGTAPAGNGVTLQVWDNSSGAWSNPQSGTAAADETLTITLTANLPNYVNDDGFCTFWQKQPTHPMGLLLPFLAAILCRQPLTCRGITFCDIHSYRDVDVVDVKPFLYKEEIQLVAWLFESVAIS